MHFIHKKTYFAWAILYISLANIVFQLFVLYEPGKDPYAWNMTQNIIYYGLARISYTMSAMVIFFVIILGHFNVARRGLQNGIFRALGKLAFQNALIFPIVILYYYGATQSGIYLTFMGVQYLAVGNMASIALAGFVLYLLVEYPFKALLNHAIGKKISHDDLLRDKLMPVQLYLQSPIGKKLQE